MTTIDAQADVVTLINVFTVDADKQQELIDLLDKATNEVMRTLPGFVSANIHRGVDGTHVANYAQWASEADFQAMLANPVAREHLAAALEIATATPLLYRVASVHHA